MERLVAVTLTIPALLLSACASQPEDVTAKHVSTIQYNSYSCTQVESEMSRVKSKVHEVTGQQQKEADEDAIATGVGVFLFWPALFFLADDDKADELGRLKGEYDALERVAIEKDCSFAANGQADQEA